MDIFIFQLIRSQKIHLLQQQKSQFFFRLSLKIINYFYFYFLGGKDYAPIILRANKS